MHTLLIQNDASGSAQDHDAEAGLTELGCEVVLLPIAEAAELDGRDLPTAWNSLERVVVAGGDGSIGPAARIARRLGVPLAVLPAGTANDFARAMELPADAVDACELAATGQHTRPVDLADIDGHPFVNVASLGLSPAAAEHADRLKGGLRALAYPIGALLAARRARPIGVVLEGNGSQVWSGRALQVIVANSGAFGGWADIDGAREDDRQLDVIVVPAGRTRRALAVDAASLRTGALTEREGVLHFRASRFDLELRRPDRMVVDGELLEATGRRISVTLDPEPVQLVAGAGTGTRQD